MNPLAPRDALALVLGPAWAASTPRTDEEASVILGATEPRHALRERLASRKAAAEGRVVLEPSPRVTPGEPMPAATMARDDWREAWRDAEVPPLGALRERCEASGARATLADPTADGGVAAYLDRYGTTEGVVATWATGGDTFESVLRDRPYRGVGRDHVPADAEGVDDAQRERDARRMYPMRGARGWCEGLGAAGFDSAFVAPVVAEITWQAMRLACPERVYPEPTAGESE